MNNKNVQCNKPFIFIKKINNKYKVIPLNVTTNIIGLTRYFPSATKEWINSIYTFNNSYIKNLSVADKSLVKLIKGYFNLYFNKWILGSKYSAIKFRRLFVNKIYISKAELKHTNSKVIITLYVYNEERRALICKLKRLETILFSSVIQNKIIENKLLRLEDKLDMLMNQENNVSFIDWLCGIKSYIIKQIELEEHSLSIIKITKSMEDKKLMIENLNKSLVKIMHMMAICKNDSISYNKYENIYKNFFCKMYLEREINIIAYYKLLLNLNKSKFENKFLSKLESLVTKLYNKKVEFNIINLKALYLNSNMFIEAVSLKLKNRNNKLLQILKSSLSIVKFPKVNRVREQYNKVNVKKLWINKVNNLYIDMKNIDFYENDVLNKLLLELFYNSSLNKDKYLSNLILNSLRYKNVGGIRLETKGRLTRRFTASRSVFKIRWKGSLKNIDSSYKGLSSIMLRGYAKPNIQYSLINSKTRNGAFGLKGWISSK
jgi:hypothetical protein